MKRKRTIERGIHYGMIQRCTNPNNSEWHRYGGRGITVCARWLASYSAFLEDMGPRPEGTSLDRINNDGNYEPSNCRWATWREQSNNTRVNHMLQFNGKSQTMRQWSRAVGLPPTTIRTRLSRGWSVDRALTEPSHEYRFKKPGGRH